MLRLSERTVDASCRRRPDGARLTASANKIASIARARLSFDARLGRCGRVMTQVSRCMIAHDGMASMADLRAWCYVGQPFQRWQCWSIKRALFKLGAKQIGRAGGVGRPAIYAIV